MKNTLFHGEKLRRLALILSVFVVVGLSGCSIFARSNKAVEVDLTQYIDVTVDGKDGEGTADITIDTESLLSDLMSNPDNKSFFKKNEKKVESFTESITVNFDKDTKLSNGDELVFEVEYDEDLAKDLKISITQLENYKVDGLKTLVDYDPFSDVTVTYSGISPFIVAEVEYDSSLDIPLDVEFTVDKDYYARGEAVVITAEYDKAEAENYSDVNVTKTENEYKAESDFAYVRDPSELYDKAELFDYIYNDFQSYVTSDLADGSLWKDIPDHVVDTCVQSSDITIDSAYFLFTKEEDGNVLLGSCSELVLIVKVPFVYPEDPAAGEQYRYLAITLPDIQLDADNKLFVSYSDLSYGFPQEDRVNVYDKNVQKYSYDYEVTEIPVQDLPAFPSLAGAAAATPAAGEATATPAATPAA